MRVADQCLGVYVGFASTGDGYLKGNYGLWDQRMAMVYVKNAISAYGGDPNKVTIFGQSAGASSSGLHLVSPNATGSSQLGTIRTLQLINQLYTRYISGYYYMYI